MNKKKWSSRAFGIIAVLAALTQFVVSVHAAPRPSPSPYAYFHDDLNRVMGKFIEQKNWDALRIADPPERDAPWTSTYGTYSVRWVNDYQTKYVSDAISQTSSFLWDLPGILGSGDASGILSVAASQIGNTGGRPYWSWYGFDHREPWCAAFVCWCANQCGLDGTVIPHTASAGGMRDTMKSWGRFSPRVGYTPSPGDLIFFTWVGTSQNHVGIVEKVEGGQVHTIEGNTGDRCLRRHYDLSNPSIVGYGRPDYPTVATPVVPSVSPSLAPGP